jgi:hypothetical protein
MRRTLERLPFPRQFAVDADALPLKAPFTRATAGVIGAAVHGTGVIALALSVWAFTVLPALQTQETRVSATILPDWDCAMLTKYRMEASSQGTGDTLAQKLVAGMRRAWERRDATVCGAGFQLLTYDALFPTYADCMAAYDVKCTGFVSGRTMVDGSWPPPSYSGRLPLPGICGFNLYAGTFANCSMAPGIALLTVGVGGGINPTEADVLAVIKEGLSADAVCSPFRNNQNPPYLCTRAVRLGAFQIAAQSLSIAQATVQALLFLAVVAAGWVSTACAPRRVPVFGAAEPSALSGGDPKVVPMGSHPGPR